jgi:hypothetical protein
MNHFFTPPAGVRCMYLMYCWGCVDGSGSEHGEEEGGQNRRQAQRWVNIVVLLAFWAVFVAFQLMLSHWPKCSPAYWAIFSLQAGLCLVAEAAVIRVVRARACRPLPSAAPDMHVPPARHPHCALPSLP